MTHTPKPLDVKNNQPSIWFHGDHKPFDFKNNQPSVWFHKDRAKSNQYCLYCHRPVFTDYPPSNKEHLIGRSFVPDGSLDGGKAFNFIFRACIECNNEKANAERHISSVSLFTSPSRVDENINTLAKRKAATDFHPTQRGKLVRDAGINELIKIEKESLSIKFGLIAPPQICSLHAQLLAFRHIQGLFSLISCNDPKTTEGTLLLPREHWWFGGAFPHSDWGNAQIKEITQRVELWEKLLNIDTANGFFKAIIRRSPNADGPWFWALEWNKSWRLFGGIFDIQNPPNEFKNLPAPKKEYIGHNMSIYQETQLEEHEDKLF